MIDKGIHRMKQVATVGALLIVSSACSALTPHQNFKMHMENKIGMSIDAPPAKTGIDPADLVSTRALPNGNFENGYQYGKTCRYFFEVNSKTRVVVAWRFEGSEEDCAIVP